MAVSAVSAAVVFMLIAGYSCKDMSALVGKMRREVLSAGQGTSGTTAGALVSYLAKAKAPIDFVE
eukprot:1326282-Prorocentrum_lima.AAC.1